MFVEIHFPPDALAVLDRDTVEDAITRTLQELGCGEVTGAGLSFDGSGHLDVELSSARRGLPQVRNVLRALHVPLTVELRVNGAVLSVYDDAPPPKAPRQKKGWQPCIGDVIEIPLPRGEFAYCRATPQRHVYEFFGARSTKPLSVESLRGVPTFRPSTFWDLGHVSWRVVGTIPFDRYEPQQYRIAHAPVELRRAPDGMLDTGDIIPRRVLSAEELDVFEPIQLGGPEFLIRFLDARLPAAAN